MSSVYVVCWIFLQTFQTYFCIQANSVDPVQTAPRGAVWSGSTLFAKMTFKITSRRQSRRLLLWLAVYGLNTIERDKEHQNIITMWEYQVNAFCISSQNVFLWVLIIIASSNEYLQHMFSWRKKNDAFWLGEKKQKKQKNLYL